MNSSEQIDVIIPFHRIDEYLKLAIESAKSSNDVTVRIIAINDSGYEVVKDQIGLAESDLLLRNTSKGYVNALGLGVENTTAGFVAFLDSDDLTHPGKLASQLQLMLEFEYDLVSCEIKRINKNGDLINVGSLLGATPNPSERKDLWIIGSHGADSTLLVRGEVLRKHWQIHRNFPAMFADYGWALSLPREIRIGHLNEPYYYYRSHENQISASPQLLLNWDLIFPLWKFNLENQFPDLDLRFQISKNSALALAFPAALPNLRKMEISQLDELVSNLLGLLATRDYGDFRRWEVTLNRRLLIASRGRLIRAWSCIPGLISTYLRIQTSSLRLRRIK